MESHQVFYSERWEKNVRGCEDKESDRQAERTRDRDRKGKGIQVRAEKKFYQKCLRVPSVTEGGVLAPQRIRLYIADFLHFDLMAFLCFQSR